MWLLISFDLPSTTPEYRKIYRLFVKELKNNGFLQLHESFFYRLCFSPDNARNIKGNIMKVCPEKGKLFIGCVPSTLSGCLMSVYNQESQKIFDETSPISLF